MKGWIKLHRKIQDHWVWQDDRYLRYWLTILLNVNHESKKFPVGDQIYECQPGESFRSISKWTDLFSCSKPTTIKFFKMLENDGMIFTKIVGKGNRRKHLLIVANWNDFQESLTENFTESKPVRLPKVNPCVDRKCTSNKKEKNEKNDKEEYLTWRNDFEIYKSELREEYLKLINDDEFLETQKRFHPGVDIKLSIEKACVNFLGNRSRLEKIKRKAGLKKLTGKQH